MRSGLYSASAMSFFPNTSPREEVTMGRAQRPRDIAVSQLTKAQLEARIRSLEGRLARYSQHESYWGHESGRTRNFDTQARLRSKRKNMERELDTARRLYASLVSGTPS
jgi:hypothetical protein